MTICLEEIIYVKTTPALKTQLLLLLLFLGLTVICTRNFNKSLLSYISDPNAHIIPLTQTTRFFM